MDWFARAHISFITVVLLVTFSLLLVLRISHIEAGILHVTARNVDKVFGVGIYRIMFRICKKYCFSIKYQTSCSLRLT